eukprot:UN3375
MLLLKRKYTVSQLQALSNAFLAVTAFTVLRVGDIGNPFVASAPLSKTSIGFINTALAVLANVTASLLAERALKGDTPWYTTVAHVKAGETLFAFTLMMREGCVPGSPLTFGQIVQSPSAVFEGFTATVWGLEMFFVGDAWMSALVVARLSSVVKALAKSLSMIVLYLLALVLGSEAFSLPLLLLAGILANASQQFAYASSLKRPEEGAATSGTVASAAGANARGEGIRAALANLRQLPAHMP